MISVAAWGWGQGVGSKCYLYYEREIWEIRGNECINNTRVTIFEPIIKEQIH